MTGSRRATTFLLLLLLLRLLQLCSAGVDSKRLYIVYMGEKQHDDPHRVTAIHHHALTSVLGSKDLALESILYSYRHGFSGFAAMLTASQAKKIKGLPGVLHVARSQEAKLQTTRSWDFLGLTYHRPTELLQRSKFGEDMIIGVIDTGLWPESKSYDDSGYGPIPSRWKGECNTGHMFTASNCNRKIIGAKWYTGGINESYLENDYLSARDFMGHGTLTSSTAVGSPVENANYRGLAAGTARGGAPRARLAMYKVGWGSEGMVVDAGVLAAIDDAIHDGVDVLSLSIGLRTIAFGSFHAVAKGITVVFAGGNSGPAPQIVDNVAPWVITVAASTLDRAFPTSITLGDNQTLTGQSLYSESVSRPTRSAMEGQNIELLDRSIGFSELFNGHLCDHESLNGANINGKWVLCTSEGLFHSPNTQISVALTNVLGGGGKGVIFAQYTTNTLDYPDELCGLSIKCKDYIPTIIVDLVVATRIAQYMEISDTPVVKISPAVTTTGKSIPSPKIATFSSRGPNAILPEVLKPDIAAPGASILAASKDSFELVSGTSLAAPHIAGVVALLKSMHPDWSPAAIKSAIMTTASTTDPYGFPIMAEGAPRKVADPFDFGSGNVNPNAAMDPGVIFDIDPEDYTNVLHCALLPVVVVCNTSLPAYTLNLPSISIPNLRAPVIIRRTVTNVGKANDVYYARIEAPQGVQMDVNPKSLAFNDTTTRLSFEVIFSPMLWIQGDYTFGSLTWSNRKQNVRIPIATRIIIQENYANVA